MTTLELAAALLPRFFPIANPDARKISHTRNAIIMLNDTIHKESHIHQSAKGGRALCVSLHADNYRDITHSFSKNTPSDTLVAFASVSLPDTTPPFAESSLWDIRTPPAPNECV